MELNQSRYDQFRDPEIAIRISAYELAFRMQSAAPELIDLSGESAETLEMYGVNREDSKVKADRAGGPGQYKKYATNCLLARRLVERGVRFVQVYSGDSSSGVMLTSVESWHPSVPKEAVLL